MRQATSQKINFVFYGRVSTVEQDNGIPAQLESCKNFAKNNNGKIVAEFSEHASGKIEDRPELLKAIEYAKNNNCTLLVAKLDRLSRKNSHLVKLWDHFQEQEIKWDVVATPNIASNVLLFSVLSGMAEQERIFISERTREGMAIAKKKGHKAGRKKGIDMTEAVKASVEKRHNDANAWASKQCPVIIAMRKSGMTLQAIADTMTKQGIKTRRGSIWTPKSISRVLEKCGYCD